MDKTAQENKKSFLECMFNDLNNLQEESDAQVKEDLAELGIDTEKALERVTKLRRGVTCLT